MRHSYCMLIVVSMLHLYTATGTGVTMRKCGALVDPAWTQLRNKTNSNVLQCARSCYDNATCDFISVEQDTCTMWQGDVTCDADPSAPFVVFKVQSRSNPNCKVGWHHYSGSCYLVADSNMNWTASQTHCASLGANLVTVRSFEEEDFVINLVTTLYPSWVKIWIAANDLSVDGVWEWVSGEPWDFEDWMDGEPWGEYQGEPEDCVVMQLTSHTKRWNDSLCRYNFRFVCEKNTI